MTNPTPEKLTYLSGDSWLARRFLFLWQGLGNLRNGGNAGLRYVNANNGLGNANWNIGGRLSGWHLSALSATSTPRAPEHDGACPLN